MRPKYKNCVSIVIIISLLFSLAGCGKSVKEDNKVGLQDDYWYYSNVQERPQSLDNDYYNYQSDEIREVYKLIKENGSKDLSSKGFCSEKVVQDIYNQMLDFVVNKDQTVNDLYKQFAKDIMAANDMNDIRSINIKLEEYGIYPFLNSYCNIHLGLQNGYGAEPLAEDDTFLGYNLKYLDMYDFTKEELQSYVYNVLISVGKSEVEAKEETDSFVDNLYEYSKGYQAENQIEYIKSHIDVEESSDVKCVRAYYDKHFFQDNFYCYKIVLLATIMYMWDDFLALDYDFLKEEQGYRFTECVQDDYDMAAAFTEKYFFRYVNDLYYDQAYSDDMVPVAEEIYGNVVAQYKEMITNCSWLSEDSKNNLIDHIDAIKIIIKRGDSSLEEAERDYLGENILDTVLKQDNIWNNDLYDIYKSKGKYEIYRQNSYEINASYMWEVNNIVVPVVTMKYFMNEKSPEEYIPALSFIFAHELGHSLDKSVIYKDNPNDTISKRNNPITEDEANYLDGIIDSLEDYYSGFTVLDKYNVNGESTASENYADLLAMECVMGMYQTKEDREKLFLNVSDFFYHDLSDVEIMHLLRDDGHTYSRVRINAMFSNSDGFYETYDIKPEDGMYVAPENRIHMFK